MLNWAINLREEKKYILDIRCSGVHTRILKTYEDKHENKQKHEHKCKQENELKPTN